MVAPVLPGDAVLDVGCNSGYIVDFLPANCRVWGIDVSPELVSRAQVRLRGAQVAAAEEIPYPDKSMDVVLLGEILEHVHDPTLVLNEASRVARRIVAGSTPHDEGKWGPKGRKKPDGHPFHVRCFTRESLEETLRAAGLHGLSIETVARDRVPQMFVFWGSPRSLCA